VITAVLFVLFMAEFVTLGVVALDSQVRPVWRWICGSLLGAQLAVLAAAILVVAVSTGVVR
jgi:hypothetical protein